MKELIGLEKKDYPKIKNLDKYNNFSNQLKLALEESKNKNNQFNKNNQYNKNNRSNEISIFIYFYDYKMLIVAEIDDYNNINERIGYIEYNHNCYFRENEFYTFENLIKSI